MRRFGWIAALALILDRLTKAWAANVLRVQPGGSIALWPGVLSLTYAENRGMAFGLLQGGQAFLIAVTGAMLLALLIYLLWKPRTPRFVQAVLWLLWGGAAGNLIDRIALSYVIDFIEVKLFRFAIFNLADSCVCVAAVLFCVWMVTRKEEGHGAVSD